MRILVTGGTGFVGRPIVRALAARGEEVVVVTRRAKGAILPRSVELIEADPTVPGAWQDEAARCDAALSLAGEHIVEHRWNDAQKRHLRESRIHSTLNLVRAFERSPRPRTLLGGSMIHYYGPQPGRRMLVESSPPGATFMAQLNRDWEAAALTAEASGARVVLLRMGVVLGEAGGALDYCAPLVRAFLGPIRSARGTGMSWIHEDDNAGLVQLALDRDELRGPVNLTAPYPISWDEFFKALAKRLHRPFTLPVPVRAARAYFGEAAQLWSGGQFVLPAVALKAGYPFRYPRLDEALDSLLPAFTRRETQPAQAAR